jgi:hypothetical protein
LTETDSSNLPTVPFGAKTGSRWQRCH